jgi:hypothetical protein
MLVQVDIGDEIGILPYCNIVTIAGAWASTEGISVGSGTVARIGTGVWLMSFQLNFDGSRALTTTSTLFHA